MDYQQDFSERVSGYLQQLKNELDEDLPRLGEMLGDVTLGQADLYIERACGLVVSYHSLVGREAKRNQSAGTGTSYYQRQKQLRAYDAKIEEALPAIFEKDGYVTAALVQQTTGIKEEEAEKRLKSLSKKYKWRESRDRQHPETVRYLLGRSSRPAGESTAPNSEVAG